VTAEDLVVDNGGDGQAVEAVRERFPQLDRKPPLAFVVKPVNSVDRGALVVSPQQKEVFRVSNFVGEEKADGL